VPPGFEVFLTEHWPLALDRVRYVGEAVALVVAETPEAAASGAERVVVGYEPLPAIALAADALAEDAPAVWEARPDNLSFRCEVGDRAATERAFETAAHVVRLQTWIPRVTGSPMEPRSAIGEYDPERKRFTLHTGSGRGVVQTRERLAAILGVPAERCRVRCGDMGGNFGTRNAFSPEAALIPWAAREVGRPVKWVAERRECFLSDYQGRDLTVSAALALDEDGRFLALRTRNVSNLGAHTVYFSPLRKGLGIVQGVYRIPAVHAEGLAVFTHTVPTAVYRSSGRPEVIYVIERLIDLCAEECGFDRVALREANLIQPSEMPYRNGVGVTYDSGDYPRAMRRALEIGGWEGFLARRASARAWGRYRGISVTNYIEGTSGIPRERAEISVRAGGSVELAIGTFDSGQGHETSFSQLAAQWLQIRVEDIEYVANDTDRISAGGGSHSGRSMRIGSLAIAQAVEALLERARALAAHLLQASPEALAYEDGTFSVPGHAATTTLFELAAAAERGEGLPAALRGPLAGAGDVTNRDGAYPSGCHVCEVEIDPDTGALQIVGWAAADDIGRAVNPLILHGQTHGAIAQGAGQALLERCYHDAETAQLLAASFMDYAMPRADTLPSFATELLEIPATSHPFGIRPGGEGGTTPALACVVNAAVDALSDLGVRHIEMPLSPERIWQAIQKAKKGSVLAL